MKQDETGVKMKSEYRKYFLIMVLCFLVGGFAITTYLIQAYSDVWGRDFFGFRQPRMDNFTNLSNERERLAEFASNRAASFASPFALMTLISGIILILGGLSIWSLTREKELKHAKDKITNMLLLPEERIVIDELKKSGGQITQSQLVIKTGLSKVKVHRVVKNLAMKGIIKKYEYGLTNKIVLEKEI
jgi:hypothetical protein